MRMRDTFGTRGYSTFLDDVCQRETAVIDPASLTRIAVVANRLAKYLKDRPNEQRQAYNIKNEACELLMASGGARPVNIKPNGTVGFELEARSGVREVHIPMRELSRSARNFVRERIATLPAVARLGEIVATERA